jgi:hypothetical protein
MKKKRIVLLMSFCMILSGVLYSFACWTLPFPGVTKANHDRIEIGMPSKEVFDLLGTPDFWKDVRGRELYWEGDDGICHLIFDGSGAVTMKIWRDQPRTYWQKVKDIFSIFNEKAQC